MLDVALLDVLSHQIKLLRIIKGSFFFIGLPKDMPLIASGLYTHHCKKPWQKISPRFFDLPDFSLNEGDEFVGCLPDPSLQVSQTIIEHLVEQHA